MDQQELNEAIGKKIIESCKAQLGALVMETIQLKAANAVMSEGLTSAHAEIRVLKETAAVKREEPVPVGP